MISIANEIFWFTIFILLNYFIFLRFVSRHYHLLLFVLIIITKILNI